MLGLKYAAWFLAQGLEYTPVHTQDVPCRLQLVHLEVERMQVHRPSACSITECCSMLYIALWYPCTQYMVATRGSVSPPRAEPVYMHPAS